MHVSMHNYTLFFLCFMLNFWLFFICYQCLLYILYLLIYLCHFLYYNYLFIKVYFPVSIGLKWHRKSQIFLAFKKSCGYASKLQTTDWLTSLCITVKRSRSTKLEACLASILVLEMQFHTCCTMFKGPRLILFFSCSQAALYSAYVWQLDISA